MRPPDDIVALLGVPRDRVHVAYLGVEPHQFHPGRRDERPMLLYLGRLKQYKRVEVALDVLEACPEATLEIAGDGEWGEVIRREVDERGLHDRVTMHGFVSENEKVELFGRAWLNLTASSAEGWCLTVMEAAACGTPSGALRVAASQSRSSTARRACSPTRPRSSPGRSTRSSSPPPARRARGERAGACPRVHVGEHRAGEPRGHRARRRRAAHLAARRAAPLGDHQGGRARGRHARVQRGAAALHDRLHADPRAEGYGSLAALVSAFLILLVGGQALQLAAARETALHHLGDGPRLSATVESWTRQLVIIFLATSALGYLLRDPLAHVVGVPEHAIAAGAILPTGVLWLLLSLQRGVLQGLRDYAPVGISLIIEAIGRLACGLFLVALGADVTGAFLGQPMAMALTGIGLAVLLRRRLGHPEGEPVQRSLRALTAGAWVPIGGLALLALLQNIDVIIVKHRVGGDAAGSYAAAAVAAKAVVWVAIGIALHLLPEATRRAAAGLDPLPVLRRSIGVLTVVAAPALLIFALAPTLLLRLAFGPELTQADNALLLLGLAMTVLAVGYLTVQYMLALGRSHFLWVLGVVALIEPFLLSLDNFTLSSYAALVLALQVAAAGGVLVLGLRASRRVAPV